MSTSATPTPKLSSRMQVRYIKLGQGGGWEGECIKDGIIRYGFDTAKPERFGLCIAGRWNDLMKSFRAEHKTKGTATNLTNQTRRFFEDDGSTLWITFEGERLYWGIVEPTPPKPHTDGDGVWRTIVGGWRSTDLNGEILTKDKLSGALTQLAAFRGTSCSVDVSQILIRRINGQKTPEVETALRALNEMKTSVLGLIRLLGPQDFETLVDLVFSTSGWRRLGPVGKTQKTLDLDLMLPSTGDRAFVQVKAKTTSVELAAYVAKIDEIGPDYRMFYVYHSGDASTKDDRVIVIGPEKLPKWCWTQDWRTGLSVRSLRRRSR